MDTILTVRFKTFHGDGITPLQTMHLPFFGEMIGGTATGISAGSLSALSIGVSSEFGLWDWQVHSVILVACHLTPLQLVPR